MCDLWAGFVMMGVQERPRGIVLDLFAGPRGWSEGLREWGYADVGVEHDVSACRTAVAAGHATIRADVRRFAWEALGRVWGLIGSPPCQSFSSAGNRSGVSDLPRLHELARRYIYENDVPAEFDDERTGLVLEPLRYAVNLQPEWIALEQVPEVLPLWGTFAHVLNARGWQSCIGILNAADYGVPQTRRRAFLLAHRRFQPSMPLPTHDRAPMPDLFGGELLPWVSMADALGWSGFEAAYQRGAGMTERHGERPARPDSEPAPTLTGSVLGAGAGAKLGLVVRTGNNSISNPAERYESPVTNPAPTVSRNFGVSWRVLHTNRGQTTDGDRQTRETSAPAPAPALSAKAGGQWAFDRPATAVCGDPRISDPGYRKNGENRFTPDAIRLTVRDALILQSFRPDYPVQGTKTKQFEQVGNAVPPLLAKHVLGQVCRGS